MGSDLEVEGGGEGIFKEVLLGGGCYKSGGNGVR
jgi:hypothetical protein